MEIKYYNQFKDEENGKKLGDILNELLNSRKGTYDKIYIITNYFDGRCIEKLSEGLKKVSKNTEFNFLVQDLKMLSLEDMKMVCENGINIHCFNEPLERTNYSWYVFEGKNIASVIITTLPFRMDGLYFSSGSFINMIYDLKNEENINEYKHLKKSILNYLDFDKRKTSLISDIYEKEKEKFDIDSFEIELLNGDSIELSEIKSLQEENKNISYEDNNNDDIENEEEFDVELGSASEISNSVIEKLNEIETEERKEVEEIENNQNKTEEFQLKLDKTYEEVDIEKMLFEQNKADIDFDIPKPPIKNSKRNNIFVPDKKNVWRAEDHINEKPTNMYKEDEEELLENNIDNQTIRSKIVFDSMSKKNKTINTFFIQIPDLVESKSEIKMPIIARDYDTIFWGWPDSYNLVETTSGRRLKLWNVPCKIINVEEPEKTGVEDIKLYQQEGKTGFVIYSKTLLDFKPDENDILRIIRTNTESHIFEIELIRQSSKEYVIWKQFCTYPISKSSNRKYGFG